MSKQPVSACPRLRKLQSLQQQMRSGTVLTRHDLERINSAKSLRNAGYRLFWVQGKDPFGRTVPRVSRVDLEEVELWRESFGAGAEWYLSTKIDVRRLDVTTRALPMAYLADYIDGALPIPTVDDKAEAREASDALQQKRKRKSSKGQSDYPSLKKTQDDRSEVQAGMSQKQALPGGFGDGVNNINFGWRAAIAPIDTQPFIQPFIQPYMQPVMQQLIQPANQMLQTGLLSDGQENIFTSEEELFSETLAPPMDQSFDFPGVPLHDIIGQTGYGLAGFDAATQPADQMLQPGQPTNGSENMFTNADDLINWALANLDEFRTTGFGGAVGS